MHVRGEGGFPWAGVSSLLDLLCMYRYMSQDFRPLILQCNTAAGSSSYLDIGREIIARKRREMCQF
jgi:hypothetical protein